MESVARHLSFPISAVMTPFALSDADELQSFCLLSQPSVGTVTPTSLPFRCLHTLRWPPDSCGSEGRPNNVLQSDVSQAGRPWPNRYCGSLAMRRPGPKRNGGARSSRPGAATGTGRRSHTLERSSRADCDLRPVPQGALVPPAGDERGGIAVCWVAAADGHRQAVEEGRTVQGGDSGRCKFGSPSLASVRPFWRKV